MSRKSTEYSLLASNIYKLQKTLLPLQKLTGAYTEEEKIRIKTFRVMAHAELEFYFENRCMRVIEATKTCSNPRTRPKILASLKCYAAKKEGRYNTKKNDADVINEYRSKIKDNHGVKENNIYGICNPLGIPIEVFNPSLIATLDSYGSIRGFFAHNAINHTPQDPSIHVVLDPTIEKRAIASIIYNIRLIDKIFESYLV